MKRRTLLAGMGATALAARSLAAPVRRFGSSLSAGLLEKAPPGPLAGNPRTVDPHLARTRLERELAALLHLPLFAQAAPHFSAREAGLLVEQASLRDPRLWLITLRAGLWFSNGDPLTGADVAASLLRSMTSPAGRALSVVLADVRALDDRRVEIETRFPVPNLAPILSGLSASIVSAKGIDPATGPIGAGGFRRGQHDDGPALLFTSNPQSPAGRAWLDTLKIVPAEYIGHTLPVSVASAHTTSRERLSADVASTIYLLLSSRLSPDLRSRAATAPDVQVMTDVFLQGRAHPAGSLLPPGLLGPLARPAVAPVRPPRNPTRTKLSLFIGDSSSEIQSVADRLVVDLLEAGIAATVGWKTPEALEETVIQDRYDLVLAEWIPADFDPGRALAGAAKDPLIAPGIPDPAAALALASLEDRDARAAAAVALADKITVAGTLVPLVHPRRVLRVASSVTGLAFDEAGGIDWCMVGWR